MLGCACCLLCLSQLELSSFETRARPRLKRFNSPRDLGRSFADLALESQRDASVWKIACLGQTSRCQFAGELHECIIVNPGEAQAVPEFILLKRRMTETQMGSLK